MANAYNYSNVAVETALSGSIAAGATSMNVDATTGFPGGFPYILAVDYGAATEELVKVTAATGTTLTITRAFGGTSDQSHSLGAKVRHVFNAQDATDFRTHEAATTAHGLAGTLVGTTDTQTLTNKTLTSPTVNSGSLSGTFSGTPTFSGALSFTGGPTFTTLSALFERGLAADPAIHTRVTADTQSRLTIGADGKMTWGPGNAAGDTVLYRDSADTLKTNDRLVIERANLGDDALSIRTSGDTNSRILMEVDTFGQPALAFGSGSSSLLDTNLYRSAADTLKTDDNLVVGGTFTAGNVQTGAWTAWTPTWTTSGASTPSYGNATLDCAYVRVGRTILFRFEVVFGTTTNFGAASDNWRFSLPVTASAQHQAGGWFELNASTNARCVARARFTTTGVLELEISSGRPDGAAISSTGLIDAAAPWTWASGNAIRGTGSYEAAA